MMKAVKPMKVQIAVSAERIAIQSQYSRTQAVMSLIIDNNVFLFYRGRYCVILPRLGMTVWTRISSGNMESGGVLYG